jgi:xylulokinase
LPRPGWAKLDAVELWQKVKRIIRQVATQTQTDPIQAVAVSSLGEAVVQVAADRRILGLLLLNFDSRGAEYLPRLSESLNQDRLYRINGNTLGNNYSLTKLLWLKEHQPDLYAQTYKFLHGRSHILLARNFRHAA